MSAAFLVSSSLLCSKSRLLKAPADISQVCSRQGPAGRRGVQTDWCFPKLNFSSQPLVLGISIFMEQGSQLEEATEALPGGWNAVGVIP